MGMIEIAVICIIIFVYVELAVFFGYYMYLLTSKGGEENPDKKQVKRYSIIAGVAFPITFAIIMANKAAERR
ncbi:hypothetical protein D7V94_01815 [Parablautia intestinalis]|uniref:Uncharacterized protein n=1 Tax=Parablautia intestinalis TaxID=2320100 RepID=A0A3A9ATB7_9FIRM|nr:hypothetical protein [Parablautia intestinalis]RKI94304.1 hypothetical protein D7V94_01815 [Parablautia intestinalis]